MIWFGKKYKEMGTLPLTLEYSSRKGTFKKDTFTYYTICLDVKKYNRWLAARRANGADINHSKVAEQIGYHKSLISKHLHKEKYGLIELGPRFIGTFLKVFGFGAEGFQEIFKIIPVSPNDHNPQNRYRKYNKMNNFLRQDQEKLPYAYWAR